MSQQTVGLIGPRASAERPQRQKKDDIDRILEGLQIANGVLGIGVNFTKIQEQRANTAAIEEERSGILSRQKELDAMRSGLGPVDPGTPGAQTFKFRTGPGESDVHETTLGPLARAAKTPLQAVTTRDASGKETTTFVTPTEGATYTKEPIPKDPKQGRDISVQERNTLQNQYDRDPQVRKNAVVMDQYTEAVELAKDASPASDFALVVAFVKSGDPSSIVKESEAETAQALANLEQRARGQFSKLVGDGTSLTPEQRADLLGQIRKRAEVAAKQQSKINEQFLQAATKRGVDPADIRTKLMPSFEQPSVEQEKPAAGTATAAPSGQPQTPPVSAIEEEMKRRNLLKPSAGASGRY